MKTAKPNPNLIKFLSRKFSDSFTNLVIVNPSPKVITKNTIMLKKTISMNKKQQYLNFCGRFALFKMERFLFNSDISRILMRTPKISVVMPCFNEEQNLQILFEEIKSALRATGITYEVIFIDDGSTDSSFNVMEKIYLSNKNIVKVIKLKRNFGQTFAWHVGFKSAKGRYIVTMDCDLQNDPKDIKKLLTEINKSYDVVSGWRFNRKDDILKKFYSSVANLIRQRITDDKTHDSGCSLKIYKKEILERIELYGEMHRYITSILQLKGARIGEIKVNHRKRQFGKTKYGSIRLVKGLLDLMFIKFWSSYSLRPLHFFGSLGLLTMLFGVVIAVSNLLFRILKSGLPSLQVGPLLLLGSLMVILGIQFIVMGFLGEIMIRLYYSNKDESEYKIEKKLG